MLVLLWLKCRVLKKIESGRLLLSCKIVPNEFQCYKCFLNCWETGKEGCPKNCYMWSVLSNCWEDYLSFTLITVVVTFLHKLGRHICFFDQEPFLILNRGNLSDRGFQHLFHSVQSDEFLLCFWDNLQYCAEDSGFIAGKWPWDTWCVCPIATCKVPPLLKKGYQDKIHSTDNALVVRPDAFWILRKNSEKWRIALQLWCCSQWW